MKRNTSIFFCVLLLTSCGKERNAIPSPGFSGETTPTTAGFYDSSEKRKGNSSEALEVQIPLSNEQLKKWIPGKVGGMEQRKLIVGHKQGMEMSGAIATYQEEEDDEKQVSLEVLDGAGATGAVMLKSIKQKLTLDYEESMSSGYSRIYERDGIRVWEKLNSESHFVEIEFILKDRYHFIIKGHEIEMVQLWAFVKEVREEMG